MSDPMSEVGRQLIAVGRRFDTRGWVLGTSGNFSTVLNRDPLRVAVTRSGTSKGDLTDADILEVGEDGLAMGARPGRASAEVQLHLEIVRRRGAGAVLHTHSIWSTLVSESFAPQQGVAIEGYEMLKGLEGVTTHVHREWLPILTNAQDMTMLARDLDVVLTQYPAAHGFLLQRHGLYTWGDDLPQAVRHIEILEFLLEAVGRTSGG